MSQMALWKKPHRGWPIRCRGHWLVEVWHVFRRAPIRLYALAVLPMLVEVALQFGVPTGGVVLSKRVVPMVPAWSPLMAHRLWRAIGRRLARRWARCGRYAPRCRVWPC